jgi:hypothetical protein
VSLLAWLDDDPQPAVGMRKQQKAIRENRLTGKLSMIIPLPD